MATKVGLLGQQIFQSKYYGPGENEPEHLFARVAKVCTIPTAIDFLVSKADNNKGLGITQAMLNEIFEDLSYLAERVCKRRSISIDPCITRTIGFDLVPPTKDRWRDERQTVLTAMANLDFMPATPTLISAGRTGMLSSCFFLRVEDSMEAIFDTVKKVALISQKGGGVGLDISPLRPEGAPVSKTNGHSSGPISFLRVFNETGNQVKGGGIRRAAMMATMSVTHPDIMKFIKCKEKEGELTNFNISVLVTDDFMQAVQQDKTIVLSHPKSPDRTEIPARKIWNLLVSNAANNGEPGIVFYDTINKADIFRNKYGNLGLNPCSELTLLNGESCILAAINLSNCYDSTTNVLDVVKLDSLVRLGVTFLDNVVDLNDYPLPEIELMSLKTRRIGLGVMGLHDLLLKMKIRYGSDECTQKINEIYARIKPCAEHTSAELGAVRGVPEALMEIGLARRNGGLLTVQPTGTVSIICNASSGIEPVFQWEYTRKDSFGTHRVRHFVAEQFLVSEEAGSVFPSYATTALEVTPEEHVNVQATVQKYIDSAISKTVNMPNTATRKDVDRIYRMAYALGCKSITVYRSGSRTDEVLVKDKADKVKTEIEEEAMKIEQELTAPAVPTVTTVAAPAPELSPVTHRVLRTRPRVLFGATYCYNSSGGRLYVTISEDAAGIREVFINVSKAGSEVKAHVEATGRLISNSLKYGIPADVVIGHLRGQKSSPVYDHGKWVLSVPDAVGQAMEEYHKNYAGFSEFIEDPLDDTAKPESTEKHDDVISNEPSGELCVECGENMLVRESGCLVCKSCGFEKCGG
jgi:ribonucleoside-diphosphate reductase alpha chain